MVLPLNGSHCGLTRSQIDALRAELMERAQIERIGIRFREKEQDEGTLCLSWIWSEAKIADGPVPVPAAMLLAGAPAPNGDAWDLSVPDAATAVVKRIEGFSTTPYDDNGEKPGGTWTIGYGSIVDATGLRVTSETASITEEQALALLLRDMAGAARSVRNRVRVRLRMHEAAALISWTYNLGEGSLASSTLLRKINGGEPKAVPAEMRKWILQEGRPLLGLLRRRWAETAIYLGMDSTKACVRAWREIDSLDDWPEF